MDPEPQSQPRPEPRPEPRPDPSLRPDPYQGGFGGDDSGEEKKKRSNKIQSILAVVILAAVAIGGAIAFVPHHSTDQETTSPSQQQSVDSSNAANTQGSYSVAVDGQPYGTYNSAQNSVLVDRFFKAGDSVTVTCLAAPSNAQTIKVVVGTNIRVYESKPLHVGEEQTWSVRSLKKGEHPGNYADSAAINWFRGQAQSGSAVAEYGLGNMYAIGIENVPVDHAKALNLFQQAAQQNFNNAAARATHEQEVIQAGN